MTADSQRPVGKAIKRRIYPVISMYDHRPDEQAVREALGAAPITQGGVRDERDGMSSRATKSERS